MVANDPIIFANTLAKIVKELVKEGVTPETIRQLTLNDLRRFYSPYKAISLKKT